MTVELKPETEKIGAGRNPALATSIPWMK